MKTKLFLIIFLILFLFSCQKEEQDVSELKYSFLHVAGDCRTESFADSYPKNSNNIDSTRTYYYTCFFSRAYNFTFEFEDDENYVKYLTLMGVEETEPNILLSYDQTKIYFKSDNDYKIPKVSELIKRCKSMFYFL